MGGQRVGCKVRRPIAARAAGDPVPRTITSAPPGARAGALAEGGASGAIWIGPRGDWYRMAAEPTKHISAAEAVLISPTRGQKKADQKVFIPSPRGHLQPFCAAGMLPAAKARPRARAPGPIYVMGTATADSAEVFMPWLSQCQPVRAARASPRPAIAGRPPPKEGARGGEPGCWRPVPCGQGTARRHPGRGRPPRRRLATVGMRISKCPNA
jgi:hypothetical protein